MPICPPAGTALLPAGPLACHTACNSHTVRCCQAAGLTSRNVTLNGEALHNWEVFPLQFDDVESLAHYTVDAVRPAAAQRRMKAAPKLAMPAFAGSTIPAFFRCAGGRVGEVLGLKCALSGLHHLSITNRHPGAAPVAPHDPCLF